MRHIGQRWSAHLSTWAGLAAAGAATIAGCGSGPSEAYDGRAVCEDVSATLRSCELLSEGEPNCGLFADQRYGECASACVRAATCAELRAQACDDADNEAAACIDRCQAELAVFECGDGTRVAREARCDGSADCADGADEDPDECATPAPFACGDGTRVAADSRCDEVQDCANAADEAGCPQRAMTLCPGGF